MPRKFVHPGLTIQPLELPPDAKYTAHRRALSKEMHDVTNVITNLDGIKRKANVRTDSSGVLAWVPGKKKARKDSMGVSFPAEEFRDSRPTSAIEQENPLNVHQTTSSIEQDDPLNVHQMILRNMQGATRAPITSAYDLANLITNTCADVFDQFKTPPDFQFFDFFERSIGDLVSYISAFSTSRVN